MTAKRTNIPGLTRGRGRGRGGYRGGYRGGGGGYTYQPYRARGRSVLIRFCFQNRLTEQFVAEAEVGAFDY